MTVDEIRLMDDDFLPSDMIAEVMRMSPDRLRKYARTDQLPFPTRISGNRITVSRVGFLNWVDGKKPEPELTETDRQLKRIADALEMILQMKGAAV